MRECAGFNSTYHLTEVPSFVSRQFLVMFDPSLRFIGAGPEPGLKFDLSEVGRRLREEFPDFVAPYQGVFGCRMDGTPFDGTLFRLPLRTEEQETTTRLGGRHHSPESIRLVLRDFAVEAADSLLFLKHVRQIDLYEWQKDASSPTQVYAVRILNPSKSLLLERSRIVREGFREGKGVLFEQSMDLTIRREVFAATRDVWGGLDPPVWRVERDDAFWLESRDERWLVCSQLGGASSTSLALSDKGKHMRVIPYGGVAACVALAAPPAEGKRHAWGNVPPLHGRVFTFLPLPLMTGLGFHVNGFFEISSSRRELLVSAEDVDDASFAAFRAKWNRSLLQDVVGQCATRLLLECRELLPRAERIMDLLPGPGAFGSALWRDTSRAIYAAITDYPVLPLLREEAEPVVDWAPPSAALLCGQSVFRQHPLAVKALRGEGSPVCVLTDELVQLFLDHGGHSPDLVVSPRQTRQLLRSRGRFPSAPYGWLILTHRDVVMSLLRLCTSDVHTLARCEADTRLRAQTDKALSELVGTPLAPRADGTVARFPGPVEALPLTLKAVMQEFAEMGYPFARMVAALRAAHRDGISLEDWKGQALERLTTSDTVATDGPAVLFLPSPRELHILNGGDALHCLVASPDELGPELTELFGRRDVQTALGFKPLSSLDFAFVLKSAIPPDWRGQLEVAWDRSKGKYSQSWLQALWSELTARPEVAKELEGVVPILPTSSASLCGLPLSGQSTVFGERGPPELERVLEQLGCRFLDRSVLPDEGAPWLTPYVQPLSTVGVLQAIACRVSRRGSLDKEQIAACFRDVKDAQVLGRFILDTASVDELTRSSRKDTLRTVLLHLPIWSTWDEFIMPFSDCVFLQAREDPKAIAIHPRLLRLVNEGRRLLRLEPVVASRLCEFCGVPRVSSNEFYLRWVLPHVATLGPVLQELALVPLVCGAEEGVVAALADVRAFPCGDGGSECLRNLFDPTVEILQSLLPPRSFVQPHCAAWEGDPESLNELMEEWKLSPFPSEQIEAAVRRCYAGYAGEDVMKRLGWAGLQGALSASALVSVVRTISDALERDADDEPSVTGAVQRACNLVAYLDTDGRSLIWPAMPGAPEAVSRALDSMERCEDAEGVEELGRIKPKGSSGGFFGWFGGGSSEADAEAERFRLRSREVASELRKSFARSQREACDLLEVLRTIRWVPVEQTAPEPLMPWPSLTFFDRTMESGAVERAPLAVASTVVASDAQWLASASRYILSHRCIPKSEELQWILGSIDACVKAWRPPSRRAWRSGGSALVERVARKGLPSAVLAQQLIALGQALDAAPSVTLKEQLAITVPLLLKTLQHNLRGADSRHHSGGADEEECLMKLRAPNRVLWVGDTFASVDSMAFRCDVEASPFLLRVPPLISEFSELLRTIGVRDAFAPLDYARALSQMHTEAGKAPLETERLEAALSIIQRLSEQGASIRKLALFAPDEEGVLRPPSELLFNDAPWLPHSSKVLGSDQPLFLVHSRISNSVAQSIGAQGLRGMLMEGQSERMDDRASIDGAEAFGQTEKLTSRLSKILEQYPAGLSVISEALQNADDARASVFRVLVHAGDFPTESVLSDRMGQLNGPALYFFNDSVFREQDFAAIASIGQGLKLSQLGTVGRFGLGFSSMYHVTDTPMLVSADSLCIFDPHATFAPGADLRSPGLRVRFTREGHSSTFAKRFPDQCAPFRLFGCTMEGRYDGTIFRLPLRGTELASKSEISREAIGVDGVLNWVRQLRINAEKLLLFLRSVARIEALLVQRGATEPTPLFAVSVTREEMPECSVGESVEAFVSGTSMKAMDQGDSHSGFLARLKATPASSLPKRSSIAHITVEDFVDVRTVRPEALLEDSPSEAAAVAARTMTPPATAETVTFFVHSRVGSGLARQMALDAGADPTKKFIPLGGVAASIRRNGTLIEGRSHSASLAAEEGGQAFVFLPLPVKTSLPVHLNAFFEPTSDRRALFFGDESELAGEGALKAKWNAALLSDVLGPAWVRFLLDAQRTVGHGPAYWSLWPRSEPPEPWNAVTKSMLGHSCRHPVLWAHDTWCAPSDCWILRETDAERFPLLPKALEAWRVAPVAVVPDSVAELFSKCTHLEGEFGLVGPVKILDAIKKRCPAPPTDSCFGSEWQAVLGEALPVLRERSLGIALLTYCATEPAGTSRGKDAAIASLIGCPLMPLVTGGWGVFPGKGTLDSFCVICADELEHALWRHALSWRVVDVDEASVGSMLSALLRSASLQEQIGILPMSPKLLRPLVRGSLPADWLDVPVVAWEEPSVWISTVWQYVRRCSEGSRSEEVVEAIASIGAPIVPVTTLEAVKTASAGFGLMVRRWLARLPRTPRGGPFLLVPCGSGDIRREWGVRPLLSALGCFTVDAYAIACAPFPPRSSAGGTLAGFSLDPIEGALVQGLDAVEYAKRLHPDIDWLGKLLCPKFATVADAGDIAGILPHVACSRSPGNPVRELNGAASRVPSSCMDQTRAFFAQALRQTSAENEWRQALSSRGSPIVLTRDVANRLMMSAASGTPGEWIREKVFAEWDRSSSERSLSSGAAAALSVLPMWPTLGIDAASRVSIAVGPGEVTPRIPPLGVPLACLGSEFLRLDQRSTRSESHSDEWLRPGSGLDLTSSRSSVERSLALDAGLAAALGAHSPREISVWLDVVLPAAASMGHSRQVAVAGGLLSALSRLEAEIKDLEWTWETCAVVARRLGVELVESEMTGEVALVALLKRVPFVPVRPDPVDVPAVLRPPCRIASSDDAELASLLRDDPSSFPSEELMRWQRDAGEQLKKLGMRCRVDRRAILTAATGIVRAATHHAVTGLRRGVELDPADSDSFETADMIVANLDVEAVRTVQSQIMRSLHLGADTLIPTCLSVRLPALRGRLASTDDIDEVTFVHALRRIPWVVVETSDREGDVIEWSDALPSLSHVASLAEASGAESDFTEPGAVRRGWILASSIVQGRPRLCATPTGVLSEAHRRGRVTLMAPLLCRPKEAQPLCSACFGTPLFSAKGQKEIDLALGWSCIVPEAGGTGMVSSRMDSLPIEVLCAQMQALGECHAQLVEQFRHVSLDVLQKHLDRVHRVHSNFGTAAKAVLDAIASLARVGEETPSGSLLAAKQWLHPRVPMVWTDYSISVEDGPATLESVVSGLGAFRTVDRCALLCPREAKPALSGVSSVLTGPALDLLRELGLPAKLSAHQCVAALTQLWSETQDRVISPAERSSAIELSNLVGGGASLAASSENVSSREHDAALPIDSASEAAAAVPSADAIASDSDVDAAVVAADDDVVVEETEAVLTTAIESKIGARALTIADARTWKDAIEEELVERRLHSLPTVDAAGVMRPAEDLVVDDAKTMPLAMRSPHLSRLVNSAVLNEAARALGVRSMRNVILEASSCIRVRRAPGLSDLKQALSSHPGPLHVSSDMLEVCSLCGCRGVAMGLDLRQHPSGRVMTEGMQEAAGPAMVVVFVGVSLSPEDVLDLVDPARMSSVRAGMGSSPSVGSPRPQRSGAGLWGGFAVADVAVVLSSGKQLVMSVVDPTSRFLRGESTRVDGSLPNGDVLHWQVREDELRTSFADQLVPFEGWAESAGARSDEAWTVVRYPLRREYSARRNVFPLVCPSPSSARRVCGDKWSEGDAMGGDPDSADGDGADEWGPDVVTGEASPHWERRMERAFGPRRLEALLPLASECLGLYRGVDGLDDETLDPSEASMWENDFCDLHFSPVEIPSRPTPSEAPLVSRSITATAISTVRRVESAVDDAVVRLSEHTLVRSMSNAVSNGLVFSLSLLKATLLVATPLAVREAGAKIDGVQALLSVERLHGDRSLLVDAPLATKDAWATEPASGIASALTGFFSAAKYPQSSARIVRLRVRGVARWADLEAVCVDFEDAWCVVDVLGASDARSIALQHRTTDSSSLMLRPMISAAARCERCLFDSSKLSLDCPTDALVPTRVRRVREIESALSMCCSALCSRLPVPVELGWGPLLPKDRTELGLPNEMAGTLPGCPPNPWKARDLSRGREFALVGEGQVFCRGVPLRETLGLPFHLDGDFLAAPNQRSILPRSWKLLAERAKHSGGGASRHLAASSEGHGALIAWHNVSRGLLTDAERVASISQLALRWNETLLRSSFVSLLVVLLKAIRKCTPPFAGVHVSRLVPFRASLTEGVTDLFGASVMDGMVQVACRLPVFVSQRQQREDQRRFLTDLKLLASKKHPDLAGDGSRPATRHHVDMKDSMDDDGASLEESRSGQMFQAAGRALIALPGTPPEVIRIAEQAGCLPLAIPPGLAADVGSRGRIISPSEFRAALRVSPRACPTTARDAALVLRFCLQDISVSPTATSRAASEIFSQIGRPEILESSLEGIRGLRVAPLTAGQLPAPVGSQLLVTTPAQRRVAPSLRAVHPAAIRGLGESLALPRAEDSSGAVAEMLRGAFGPLAHVVSDPALRQWLNVAKCDTMHMAEQLRKVLPEHAVAIGEGVSIAWIRCVWETANLELPATREALSDLPLLPTDDGRLLPVKYLHALVAARGPEATGRLVWGHSNTMIRDALDASLTEVAEVASTAEFFISPDASERLHPTPPVSVSTAAAPTVEESSRIQRSWRAFATAERVATDSVTRSVGVSTKQRESVEMLLKERSVSLSSVLPVGCGPQDLVAFALRAMGVPALLHEAIPERHRLVHSDPAMVLNVTAQALSMVCTPFDGAPPLLDLEAVGTEAKTLVLLLMSRFVPSATPLSEDARNSLKRLPLFETVDGTWTSIGSGDAFSTATSDGDAISRLALELLGTPVGEGEAEDESEVILLKPQASLEPLYTALGIKPASPSDLLRRFLMPRFTRMDEAQKDRCVRAIVTGWGGLRGDDALRSRLMKTPWVPVKLVQHASQRVPSRAGPPVVRERVSVGAARVAQAEASEQAAVPASELASPPRPPPTTAESASASSSSSVLPECLERRAPDQLLHPEHALLQRIFQRGSGETPFPSEAFMELEGALDTLVDTGIAFSPSCSHIRGAAEVLQAQRGRRGRVHPDVARDAFLLLQWCFRGDVAPKEREGGVGIPLERAEKMVYRAKLPAGMAPRDTGMLRRAAGRERLFTLPSQGREAFHRVSIVPVVPPNVEKRMFEFSASRVRIANSLAEMLSADDSEDEEDCWPLLATFEGCVRHVHGNAAFAVKPVAPEMCAPDSKDALEELGMEWDLPAEIALHNLTALVTATAAKTAFQTQADGSPWLVSLATAVWPLSLDACRDGLHSMVDSTGLVTLTSWPCPDDPVEVVTQCFRVIDDQGLPSKHEEWLKSMPIVPTDGYLVPCSRLFVEVPRPPPPRNHAALQVYEAAHPLESGSTASISPFLFAVPRAFGAFDGLLRKLGVKAQPLVEDMLQALAMVAELSCRNPLTPDVASKALSLCSLVAGLCKRETKHSQAHVLDVLGRLIPAREALFADTPWLSGLVNPEVVAVCHPRLTQDECRALGAKPLSQEARIRVLEAVPISGNEDVTRLEDLLNQELASASGIDAVAHTLLPLMSDLDEDVPTTDEEGAALVKIDRLCRQLRTALGSSPEIRFCSTLRLGVTLGGGLDVTAGQGDRGMAVPWHVDSAGDVARVWVECPGAMEGGGVIDAATALANAVLEQLRQRCDRDSLAGRLARAGSGTAGLASLSSLFRRIDPILMGLPRSSRADSLSASDSRAVMAALRVEQLAHEDDSASDASRGKALARGMPGAAVSVRDRECLTLDPTRAFRRGDVVAVQLDGKAFVYAIVVDVAGSRGMSNCLLDTGEAYREAVKHSHATRVMSALARRPSTEVWSFVASTATSTKPAMATRVAASASAVARVTTPSADAIDPAAAAAVSTTTAVEPLSGPSPHELVNAAYSLLSRANVAFDLDSTTLREEVMLARAARDDALEQVAKAKEQEIRARKVVEDAAELFECKLCRENPVYWVLVPSGHMICEECSATMERLGRRECPFSRVRIERKVKLFFDIDELRKLVPSD
jgi:hypothetical protein